MTYTCTSCQKETKTVYCRKDEDGNHAECPKCTPYLYRRKVDDRIGGSVPKTRYPQSPYRQTESDTTQ